MAEPRIILALETSNPSAAGPEGPGAQVCVGVLHGDGRGEILGVEWLRPEMRHDDDLVPAIDRAMVGASARLEALGLRAGAGGIGLVAASAGPGGFTGLRVAMATAAMIAEVGGGRVVPIETARVAARSVGGEGRALVLLASKGVRTHATIVDDDAVRATPGMVDADGVGAILDADPGIGRVVGDGFVPDDVRAACAARGHAIVGPRLDAPGVLALACDDLLRRGAPGVDPAAARVIYAREPEAVTTWRALHGGNARAGA